MLNEVTLLESDPFLDTSLFQTIPKQSVYMLYLPAFTIEISHMWVHIPYMDDMGLLLCQNEAVLLAKNATDF